MTASDRALAMGNCMRGSNRCFHCLARASTGSRGLSIVRLWEEEGYFPAKVRLGEKHDRNLRRLVAELKRNQTAGKNFYAWAVRDPAIC
jgi:hypothetical protein